MTIQTDDAVSRDDRGTVAAGLRLTAFVLLTPVALVFALFGVLAGGYLAYAALVPVYSAEYRVDQIAATVRLDFYSVWDENRDNGRRLTVTGHGGRVTLNMCGFDWAHHSRTNIYLTPDGGLAVLGSDECSYMVGSKPLRATSEFSLPSEAWTYLGAFDLVPLHGSGHGLRFISAAQAPECLPLFQRPEHDAVAGLRNDARRDRCPQLLSGEP